MTIPASTEYKVLQFLKNLYDAGNAIAKYSENQLITYLLDRNYLVIDNLNSNLYRTTTNFEQFCKAYVIGVYEELSSFIHNNELQFLTNYATLGDLQALEAIKEDQPFGLSFQELLVQYFKSTKYTDPKSTLAKAIKKILNVEHFPEDTKNNQTLQILYPKAKSRLIILCENFNRLRRPRHEYIEFWYTGGRNTEPLKYIPQPALPFFYLFDWDNDGVGIYIHIKEKYFPLIKAVIPTEYLKIAIPQEEVKHHKSLWKKSSKFEILTAEEFAIVDYLIETDSIIEEQRILIKH